MIPAKRTIMINSMKVISNDMIYFPFFANQILMIQQNTIPSTPDITTSQRIWPEVSIMGASTDPAKMTCPALSKMFEILSN